MLALALITAALAGEGGDSHRNGVHVNGGVVFVPGAPIQTLGARFVAERDAYAGVDARLAPNGTFAARGGVGFDVLGRSKLDLKLGLWMGGVGTRSDAPRLEVGPAIGTEVGLGVTFDHLYARHRWMVGVGDSRLGTLLSESETTVGWRVIDDLSIYGQAVHYAPQACCGITGFGLGAEYVF